MGFFTRMLVPRSVRHAAHPVRTVRRAATPRTIKKAQRALNPVDNAIYGVQRSLNTKSRTPAKRFCRTCGQRLPRGAPGGQRYCSAACRPSRAQAAPVARPAPSPLRQRQRAPEPGFWEGFGDGGLAMVVKTSLAVLALAVLIWLLVTSV